MPWSPPPVRNVLAFRAELGQQGSAGIMTMKALINSTTDRTLPLNLRALRLWFAVESRISPRTAENRAARIFATPPRQPKRSQAKLRAQTLASAAESTTTIVVRDKAEEVVATSIGDGPTVMFLHGWGGSAMDMSALANAFVTAGYRSILFDMPGHGRSARRESSLVEFLKTIRSVTGALGPPDLIVGHSFGGAAAVFAITELGLPLRGAVLVSPAPGPAYYVNRFARAVGLPHARTEGMIRQLVRRVGRSLESLDAVVAARDATVPALVFHDPADREVPFEFATRMSEAWRQSRLVPTPSLGHKRILRDQGTIAAAIEFADSLIGVSFRAQ
jgi:pimeloyl-ACP methyl ester carboxylesterase